jgi:hypothetical protein
MRSEDSPEPQVTIYIRHNHMVHDAIGAHNLQYGRLRIGFSSAHMCRYGRVLGTLWVGSCKYRP